MIPNHFHKGCPICEHQIELDHGDAIEMARKDLEALLSIDEGEDVKGLALFDPQRTLPPQWTDPQRTLPPQWTDPKLRSSAAETIVIQDVTDYDLVN